MNRLEIFKVLLEMFNKELNEYLKGINNNSLLFVDDVEMVKIHTWIKYDKIFNSKTREELMNLFSKENSTDVLIIEYNKIGYEIPLTIRLNISIILFQLTNELYGKVKHINDIKRKREYISEEFIDYFDEHILNEVIL